MEKNASIAEEFSKEQREQQITRGINMVLVERVQVIS